MVEILAFTALLAVGADADVREVVCAEVGFSRSVENRDLEAFLAFLDPEARFVTGGIARGPEEIGQAWAAFFAPDGPSLRWRPAIVEVVAGGTLAISRGPYRLTRVDANGTALHTWGTFNSTWRRNGRGEWRVLFDAGGDHGMTPTEQDIAVLQSEPPCP